MESLDYEAELAVIIGKKGKNVKESDAMSHVFGYTIANDITARDIQKKHIQWFKGKSLDTTCPLGPYVVPACDLDPSDLSIKLWLNDSLMQDSRTSKCILCIVYYTLYTLYTLYITIWCLCAYCNVQNITTYIYNITNVITLPSTYTIHILCMYTLI